MLWLITMDRFIIHSTLTETLLDNLMVTTAIIDKSLDYRAKILHLTQKQITIHSHKNGTNQKETTRNWFSSSLVAI